MKHSLFYYAITVLLMAFNVMTMASATTRSKGIINFNVNKLPLLLEADKTIDKDKYVQATQPLTLFACNTVINHQVNGDEQNQLLKTLPYGNISHSSDNPHAINKHKQDYYISQYYVASPPAPDDGSLIKKTNIGLLTPDNFTFMGNKPAQIINFDYSILQPTYLGFVKANFNNPNSQGKTCQHEKIDLIPINVQCADFPWKNGAEGASGIGFLKNEGNKVGMFIPTLQKNGKSPLNCSVTILNDIMLTHEVLFSVGSTEVDTVNLTELYTHTVQGQNEMQLVCNPRVNSKPIGCMAIAQ